jgi:O-acetyl-ADP-ribose deacetylase (regulator of RNase III)
MVMGRITIVKGDITEQKVDAIVNAANPMLLGGGGVDGAIHRAAGPGLRDACKKLHGCKPGDAKITGGYLLPARHVIHTVGPVWQGGMMGEALTLASCYRKCLRLAAENGIKSIAFPSISTGAYSYPAELASRIALAEINGFLKENTSIVKVIIVCHDQRTCQCYEDAMKKL